MEYTADNAIWHRLIGGLIEALDKPTFWNVLVRYLSDVIHFNNWVALKFSRDQRPIVLAESPVPGGGEDELFRDYLNGFYLLDPFYLACIDDPRPGLLRLDDVAPDNFEAEDYYQRYFRLNVVADEVQFNLPVNGGVLVLSLGSQRRYSVDDMSLLAAITPWMLALMRQRSQYTERYEIDAQNERPPEATGPDAPSELARGSSNLTNRELEIVHLLLSGFSSKGIAQKLRISPETVKGHRKHIYTKLGVKSHAELFAIYLQAKNEAA